MRGTGSAAEQARQELTRARDLATAQRERVMHSRRMWRAVADLLWLLPVGQGY